MNGNWRLSERTRPVVIAATFILLELFLIVLFTARYAVAANTPGDYLIRRNDNETTAVTGSNLDMTWDTEVASSGSSVSYSAGTFTLSSGKYLALWSERIDFDDTNTVTNQRGEVQGRLVINGSATSTGAGQAYYRNGDGSCGSDCQWEGIVSGAGIIDIPNDSTSLETRVYRTDTSTGVITSNRVADWGGITLLALDDGWDYARYSLTSNTTAVDSFSDVVWAQNDEQDTGFSRSSGQITITTAGQYLVTYSIPMTVSSGARTEAITRITLDDVEVTGTRVSTYMRNSQGTDDGVLSYAGVIDVAANDVLAVEMSFSDGTPSNVNMLAGASIEIVELPSDAETFIVEATATGNMNPTTVTEFAWETTAQIDTNTFTHTNPTDSFVEVDLTGDYLFFATQATDNGPARAVSTQRFSVDDTISNYAAGAQFNRSSTADDAGSSLASLITGLSSGNDISLENLGISQGTASQQCDFCAMSGILLSSLFGGSPPSVVTNAAGAITTNSATLNGNINSTGGQSVTERGFAWGTNNTLSGGDTATTSETGSFSTGAFTSDLSSLATGTTYFFRAYAANSVGTTTGSILSFLVPPEGVSGPLMREYLYDGLNASVADLSTGSTTPTFTPPTDSLVVAAISVSNTDNSEPSDSVSLSGSGLVWTKRVDSGPEDDSRYVTQIWTAQATSSAPKTITVTDSDGGSGVIIVEVHAYTGHNTIDPIGATGSAIDTETMTLNASPAFTSEVLLQVLNFNQFSEIYAASGTIPYIYSPSNSPHTLSSYRTGSTSANLLWHSDSDGTESAAAIEIKANTSSSFIQFGSQFTWGHFNNQFQWQVTAPGQLHGNNTVLILAAGTDTSSSTLTPTSATYNGVDLGSPIKSDHIANIRSFVWVVATSTGGATFETNWPCCQYGSQMATYYSGVDQDVIYRTVSTSTGSTDPATITITNSQPGDIIAGITYINEPDRDVLFPQDVGADQSFRFASDDGFGGGFGNTNFGITDELGESGTVTHTWGWDPSLCDATCGYATVVLPLIPHIEQTGKILRLHGVRLHGVRLQ